MMLHRPIFRLHSFTSEILSTPNRWVCGSLTITQICFAYALQTSHIPNALYEIMLVDKSVIYIVKTAK